MNVCKFVCLFVPYTNSHFWTDPNQTKHTSPPWSGGDGRVRIDPHYSTFPSFSTSSVARACMIVRKNGCRRHGTSPKSVISVTPARVRVTSRTRLRGALHILTARLVCDNVLPSASYSETISDNRCRENQSTQFMFNPYPANVENRVSSY
jgi:hypothetical protein